jgi:hypothetical protein
MLGAVALEKRLTNVRQIWQDHFKASFFPPLGVG